MKSKHLLVFCCFLLVLSSCKTDIFGDKLQNKAPKTYMVTDTIALDEANRYNTNVHIRWWGDDPDGFVVGYEYTFDDPITTSSNWFFTNLNDSIFKLNIPVGNETFNFKFTIRAIDNEGLRDPNPPSLVFPVKNTPPVINLVTNVDGNNPLTYGNPKLSYPILRYNWKATDEDGDESIIGYDIWLNDSTATPVRISAGFSGLTLKAIDFNSSVAICNIFPGQSNLALPERLDGLLINDSNVFFIRAVDISGAGSSIAQSQKIYVKRPTSDILFVQTYSSGVDARENFFLNALQTAGFPQIERLELFKNEQNRFTRLAPDARTQSQIFGLFKTIIWASPDLDQTLFFGKTTLGEFLGKGGNLLISTFTKGADPITASYFDFSPIESLLAVPTGFTHLMNDTCGAYPLEPGYPLLRYTAFLPVFRPINVVAEGKAMYRASVLERNNTTFQVNNYNGNTNFIGIVQSPNNGSKVVISTLELDKLNGNGQIPNFLGTLLRNEFGL